MQSLVKTIKEWFIPPVFPEDEDKTRNVRILYALLANMLVFLLLAALATIFVFVQKTGVSIFIFALLIWILLSHTLVRRGHILAASQFFIAGAWVVFTLLLVLTGRITTSVTTLHVALIVVAGILLGERSAITLAVMSSLVGLGLAILESSGDLLIHYFPASPQSSWVVLLLALTLTLTSLYLTLQGLSQTLTRARKSEKRFINLFQEAPMMYLTAYEKDGVATISNCNAAFLKTLGYQRDQVIGQPLTNFYTPESQAAFLESGGLQPVFRGDPKFTSERNLLTKDGRIVHALFQATPEFNEEGQAIGGLVAYLDITERKRVNEMLSEVTERYRAIVEQSHDGLTIADPDGRYLVVNQAFCSMMGYSEEELLQMKVWDLVAKNIEPVLFPLILQERKPGRREVQLVRKDGTLISVSINGGPLIIKDQIFVQGNIQDITERKQTESITIARSRILQFSLTHSLTDILQNVLNECEALTGSSIGFFHFMLADQNTLSLQNWSTRTLSEFCFAEGKRQHYPLEQAGIWAECAQERRAIICNDYAIAPNQKGLPDGHAEVKRFISLPILRGEKIVAIIGVGNKPTDYSERDVEAITQLADLSWDIAERKQAETALQESQARIKSISDNFNSGMIYQVVIKPDDTRQFTYLSDSVRELYGVSPEDGLADANLIYRQIHEDDLDNLIKTEEEAVKNLVTFRAEARVRDPSGGIRWSSYFSTPMQLEDGSVCFDGVEFIITERKEQEERIIAHQAELQRLLKEADHSRRALLSALEDQKLAEEVIRMRLVEMEAVNHVSTALRIAQTTDEMLPLLLDETLLALESEAGAIWLHQPEHEALRLVAARGWFEQFRAVPIKPGEGLAGTVFKSGTTHFLREFTNDSFFSSSNADRIPNNWGGICVPIRAADETAGVIFISVPLPREITAEQAKLLVSLTEMAGTALHRSRLYEETRRQLEYLQALRLIDHAITTSLDPQVTLGILLSQVLAKLHVDSAGILLFNPHLFTLEYAAGSGFRTRAYERTNLRLGEGLAGRAALDKKLLQETSVTESQDTVRVTLLKSEGFITHIAVPFIAKGELKGVMDIFHRTPLQPDGEWLDFLESLTGQAAIAIDNAQLFEGLERSNAELRQAYDATIEGWSHALDLRDKETEGHTQRVTELTLRLARAFGLSDSELVHVQRGALLHDIGKMGIPDAILHKPGPLTEEEWVIMRKHPQYAYEMLFPIQYLHPALNIPRYHHERWDGAGYPHGLKGEEIPLTARIFTVIDNWDALTSDRPYREAWSVERTKSYLIEMSGQIFDPLIVEKFLEILETSS
ncbi:MAG TPA: hypothetical protein DEH22_15960 [Chloroflexi bacterium]|nr:hypothetical protein [Chloroflexota bacterium]